MVRMPVSILPPRPDRAATGERVAAGELVRRAHHAAALVFPTKDPAYRDEVAAEVIALVRRREGSYSPVDRRASVSMLMRKCSEVAKLARNRPAADVARWEEVASGILSSVQSVPAPDPAWTEVAEALDTRPDSPAGDVIRAALAGYASAAPRIVLARDPETGKRPAANVQLGDLQAVTLAARLGISHGSARNRLSTGRKNLAAAWTRDTIGPALDSRERIDADATESLMVGNGGRKSSAAPMLAEERIMPSGERLTVDGSDWTGCHGHRVAPSPASGERHYGPMRTARVNVAEVESRPGSDSSADAVRWA